MGEVNLVGIVNMVRTIKEIHPEDIVLVKIGSFYYAYGKDSYILSYLFSYQLKKIENIYNCAFPIRSLNKIIATLENKKINYIGVDRRNNYEVDFQFDNKNLNKYDEIFEKAKKHVSIQNRINEINNYLNENANQNNIKEIIYEIEKIINERRKI